MPPEYMQPLGQAGTSQAEVIAPSMQTAGPAEANVAVNTSSSAPAVSLVTVPRGSERTALRIPDRSSLRRSPEASDRLTRIARDRGMLVGSGIDVYLSGQVAILQGNVRTAHDRELLANIAGLEPGIQQVYNGLATDDSGVPR